MNDANPSPTPDPREPDSAASALLALVRSVADESRPRAQLGATLGLDDSLERGFGVALGEAALTDAETVRDLLRMIESAAPRGPMVEPAQQPPAAVSEAAVQSDTPRIPEHSPTTLQTLADVFAWHLQRHPERVLFTLLEDGGPSTELSYAGLHAEARGGGRRSAMTWAVLPLTVARAMPLAQLPQAQAEALRAVATADDVRTGDSLAFFPEGTFRRASGLLPFKLGAFVVAAHTGAPLVPATLNGTRSLLRERNWLPRRVKLSLTLGSQLAPTGAGWDRAIALRDAARQAIAAPLAEPANEP